MPPRLGAPSALPRPGRQSVAPRLLTPPTTTARRDIAAAPRCSPGNSPSRPFFTAPSRSKWIYERANAETISPRLPTLPRLKLLEERVLVRRRHRYTAAHLPALVDEAREERFEGVDIRCGGDLRVVAQPLRRGRVACPSRQIGRDID